MKKKTSTDQTNVQTGEELLQEYLKQGDDDQHFYYVYAEDVHSDHSDCCCC